MEPRERILEYRKAQGWSCSEAARQWKIAQPTLWKIEHGLTGIGPWVARQIQLATQGALSDLWEPKPPRSANHLANGPDNHDEAA